MNIMDVKNGKKEQQKKGLFSMAGLFRFVGDIKAEIQKISWTSREELKSYTIAVIGASFLFGFGIFFVDLAIKNALDILGLLVRTIAG